MDALHLTFKNGETLEFPFNADSTVAITTPDGPNGTQHGAWGEVANVEYVKDAGEVVTTVASTPAPQPVAEPVAAAPADPAPVAETVTPDPPVAAVPDDGSVTSSDAPQTSSTTDPAAA